MDTSTIRVALQCGRAGCPCKGDTANVHCPAHDDSTPSLSVSEKGGKVLIHCHSGCLQDAVVEALKERGLWSSSSRKCQRAVRHRRWPAYDAITGQQVGFHITLRKVERWKEIDR